MVDFHRNFNRDAGEASHHIPPHPFWMVIIRIIQGVFSVLVLGLSAYATSYFYLNGYGMAIFTFIWTLLFLVYIFLTPRSFPHLYHFWGHIAFEALTTLFWLVSFALLADYVRAWSALSSWGFLGYNWGHGISGSTSAAMTFALLNWLLFCVTLVFSLFLSRKHHTGGANVDGHHHSHTDGTTAAGPRSGGFKLSSLGGMFSKNKRGNAADVEKNGTVATDGPVNETGQRVELNDPTTAGHTNGAGGNAPYGGDGQYQQQYPVYPPPAASEGHQGGRM